MAELVHAEVPQKIVSRGVALDQDTTPRDAIHALIPITVGHDIGICLGNCVLAVSLRVTWQ